MFGRHGTRQHKRRDEVHVVVASGYRPAIATVRAGVPIRVVFHRQDDDPCTDRVIFSSPRIERRLAADGSTAVDLPARAAGEIRYTCGMGRYSGTIRVAATEDARFRSLRHARRTMTNAATVAFIVLVVGLPVVAAVALLVLDATATVIAVMAVIAAAAGLMWMTGIPSVRRRTPGRTDIAKDGSAYRVAPVDSVEPAGRVR